MLSHNFTAKENSDMLQPMHRSATANAQCKLSILFYWDGKMDSRV